jgi:hypothetical protein
MAKKILYTLSTLKHNLYLQILLVCTYHKQCDKQKAINIFAPQKKCNNRKCPSHGNAKKKIALDFLNKNEIVPMFLNES